MQGLLTARIPHRMWSLILTACLRLRNLGHGQSLWYFAPNSVDQAIRRLVKKSLDDQLDGYDVISWSLEETAQQIERHRPLWIMQGLNYYFRQHVAEQQVSNLGFQKLSLAEQRSSVEYEDQTLHELYAPPALRTSTEPFLVSQCRLIQDPNVEKLLHEYDSLCQVSRLDTDIHEEHEREVAQEVEQEIHVERPGKMQPATPAIDEQLAEYVEGGSRNLLLEFPKVQKNLIKYTSASNELKEDTTLWFALRTTADFLRVTKVADYGHIDSLLRPVNWILVDTKGLSENILLISQYEANAVFDEVTAVDSEICLFSYEPRVSRAVVPRQPQHVTISNETAWEWSSVVAPDTARQLDLFAGQLYARSRCEARSIEQEINRHLEDQSAPSLAFYKAWFAIRRRGQDFLQTHVGKIIEGRSRITEDDEFDEPHVEPLEDERIYKQEEMAVDKIQIKKEGDENEGKIDLRMENVEVEDNSRSDDDKNETKLSTKRKKCENAQPQKRIKRPRMVKREKL